MVTDQNKAVYLRFIQEVFNEGRLDRQDQLPAPAYQIRDAPPGTPPGAEGVRQVVSMFRATFPVLRITIEDQVAEGDKVCSRSTTRGTHKGVIFGIPATHKTIMMSDLTMVTIVDNRLVESWVKNDVMGAGAPPRRARKAGFCPQAPKCDQAPRSKPRCDDLRFVPRLLLPLYE